MSQSLELSNSEVLRNIATVAGISRDATLWEDDTKDDARACIRRGLRRFFCPDPIDGSIHQWRFLERRFNVSYQAPYTTGALAVSNGVAHLSGGTWPSWAADGLLRTNSQTMYINGTSGADKTVDNTSYDNGAVEFDLSTVFAGSNGASATLTITGYTVTSDDVGRVLSVESGTNFIVGVYEIVSVDTTTNRWTLDRVATSGSGNSLVGWMGDAPALYRYRFPLPDDFAEFIGGVTYSRENYTSTLLNTSDTEIRIRYGSNFKTGQVCHYSIQAGSGTDTARWYISFWPTFDANASVTAIYRSEPLDKLDASDITEDGTVVQIDAIHAETLMAAILASVDEIFNDKSNGLYHELFSRRLAASILHDRHAQGAQDFHQGASMGRDFYLLNHTPDYSDAVT